MRCIHSALDGLCADCADAAHAMEHPVFVDGCFACKVSTLQFDASVAPNHAHKPVPPKRAMDPAWERGVAGSHRPDGTFMPYIDGSLRKIHVKEAGERRSEIAAMKSRLAQTPAATA